MKKYTIIALAILLALTLASCFEDAANNDPSNDPNDNINAGDTDNGIASGTAFDALPEDWVCPVCGVPPSGFEEQ